MFFKFIGLNVYELCSSLLTPNGLGNRFSSQLHRYTKNLTREVSSNDHITADVGYSPKLADEFRNHHLGVLEEVVDATQHNVCLDNVANIFQ